MNGTARNIDIYFITLILDLFSILSFLYFNFHNSNILDLIMLGILFTLIITSYFMGIVFALISSSIVIFMYCSFILYRNVILSQTVIWSNYLWIIAIPLSSFISGRLSENINLLQNINKNLQKEYRELITIDQTTGLNNIKVFYRDINKEISRSQRYKNDLSLMIIKFEYYDELKRILGDKKLKEILKRITKCINSSTRHEDERYILSKDTLGVLMANTDIKGAEVVKERIKHEIENLNLHISEIGKNIHIDIKIGIVQYEDGINGAFELKKRAEKELEYDV
ncbi:GGDEF domain-containing protein [Clostridium lundense]|uniref:GGDEF domain-containing protein n=1 Tax=Clostridium lundense TaxID=319475 RepID=UPI000487177A|nr:diguanylate cyclase [Clostridium lundense]